VDQGRSWARLRQGRRSIAGSTPICSAGKSRGWEEDPLAVAPAQQRFDTHHLAAVQDHDGLVVQLELAGRERLPQVGRQPGGGRLVDPHTVLEYRHAALAAPLGGVQRQVGVAQQCLGVGGAGDLHHQTGAHRQAHLPVTSGSGGIDATTMRSAA
jgi:hypothetical protein